MLELEAGPRQMSRVSGLSYGIIQHIKSGIMAVGKRDISAWEIYCEIVLTRSGLITRRLKNRR